MKKVWLFFVSLVPCVVQSVPVLEIDNRSSQKLKLFLPAEAKHPILLAEAPSSTVSSCTDILLDRLVSCNVAGGVRFPGLLTETYLYLFVARPQDGGRYTFKVFACQREEIKKQLTFSELRRVPVSKKPGERFELIIDDRGAARLED